ncbi:MAG: sigma-54-dependent transcriptional regulator [Nitratireductor sp.]
MVNNILVVDDDPVQLRLLEGALTKFGYRVLKAENGEKALEIIMGDQAQSIGAVILDLIMPQISGMDVMKALNDAKIKVPVIVQTAQGGIETVVKAMRLGAFDFVVKPVSIERLESAVQKAVKYDNSKIKDETSESAQSNEAQFDKLTSQHEEVNAVLRIAKKAATSQIPILIEGQSGVGKELLAKAIQSTSDRAGKPFVTVNCGALPENLVESILFGHEKGAFTGAQTKHLGKFQEANGGTLFLDEVGELPLDLQVKLLRAIQEGEIDPVGAKQPTKVDIRIISATNRDLKDEVKEGRFREDLYYRLNVLPMKIPSLKDRKEDIPNLVFKFVKRMTKEEKRLDICSINPKVMDMLKRHSWPGNIRELENAIFRAIVLCEGDELTLDEFPQIAAQMPNFDLQDMGAIQDPQVANAYAATQHEVSMQTPSEVEFLVDLLAEKSNETAQFAHSSEAKHSQPQKAEIPATGMFGFINLLSSEGQVRSIEAIEADVIKFAIEIYNGRMSEVARKLGIGRSTLYRKLKEYNIEDDKDDFDDTYEYG